MKRIKIFLICLFVAPFSLGNSFYDTQDILNDKEKILTTPNSLPDERSDFLKQFKFIPMWKWSNGLQFIAKKRSYGLINLHPAKLKNSGYLDSNDYINKVFTVVKVHEGVVSCPRGKCRRTNVVFKIDGVNSQHEYEYTGSIEEMKHDKNQILQQIDNLVYLNDIILARKHLLNKTLFILTDEWKGDDVSEKYAKKNIPVKIVGVGVSKHLSADVAITFQTREGIKAYVDIYLSGTNIAPTIKASLKSFDDVFSFTKPS